MRSKTGFRNFSSAAVGATFMDTDRTTGVLFREGVLDHFLSHVLVKLGNGASILTCVRARQRAFRERWTGMYQERTPRGCHATCTRREIK